MNKSLISRLALVGLIAVAITLVYSYDMTRYLSLDYIKAQQATFNEYYAANTFQTLAIYFAVYVVSTALSIPGAAILTLLGGALFGLAWGTVIVSFASSIGATVAFLAARFLLRDYVQDKFKHRLKTVNAGVERDGDFYLFTLRLVPVVPFFVINLAMGLTTIQTWRFYVVSQLGMLLGTVVYVNAGTQLSQISSLGDIVSPSLLLSFVALGFLPLISRKVLQTINSRKLYKRFQRPRKFDYNLIAIGGGAAGLVTSYIASAVKARVALIEKHQMGGDCLNTGCVPSKALIRSAKFMADARRASDLGIAEVDVKLDFAQVMARVKRVIAAIEPHDSVERYTNLGVDCVEGQAIIKTPFEVEVNGKLLTTKNIVIATGGRPLVPNIPGLEDVAYFTSDTIWNLTTLPKRLLVIGGGPIGCELAQSFARFGSEVTIVDQATQLLTKEDFDVAELVLERFQSEGVRVLLEHKVCSFIKTSSGGKVQCRHRDDDVNVEFDVVLLALGRQANVSGFGLEELGVRLADNGTIATDEYLRTNYPNIYACGDVTGSLQFTHVSAHEAWFASVNALFSPLKSFRADYRVIPWATYTDPEVARVGHSENSAKAAGIEYEVVRYGIDDLDRAIVDEQAHGFIKVLTVPGKDRILGVAIVGAHAGDIIAEFVTAMRHGLGLNKVLSTIHIYPTYTEANKYAAGVWKKAHAPQGLLRYVEMFHNWRRGHGFRLVAKKAPFGAKGKTANEPDDVAA